MGHDPRSHAEPEARVAALSLPLAPGRRESNRAPNSVPVVNSIPTNGLATILVIGSENRTTLAVGQGADWLWARSVMRKLV
jgi:hypothetical protein